MEQRHRVFLCKLTRWSQSRVRCLWKTWMLEASVQVSERVVGVSRHACLATIT